MAQSQTGLMDYVRDEVQKYKGIYVPIRSGFLRRLLVRRLACAKLHPNPDDEFCKPEVGPNFGIISRYSEQIRNALTPKERFKEPLIVERIRPDGYMLLNGHHRWAAAFMNGLKKVPVQIVNVTQETDIKKMLGMAKSDRRAALDLDEVVFSAGGDEPTEKGVPFPFSLAYAQRLRLGIPALFHYLNVHDYDIWVYSDRYYSLEYVRTLFRLYHVRVTGIVTGAGRKRPGGARQREKLEGMVANHYAVTLSIDREALLRVDRQTKSYEEYSLGGAASDWSSKVMETIGSIHKK